MSQKQKKGRTIEVYSSQKSTLLNKIFLILLIGLPAITAYEVMQPTNEAQAGYITPEAVREQSQQCFTELSVVECAELTKKLESQAETAQTEAELRKEAINKLFND